MFNPRVAGLLLSYCRLRLSDSDVNPLIVACIVPVLQPFFPIDPSFQSTSPLCSRLEYSIVVPNTRVSAHLESPATLDTPPGSRTHTLLARHILPIPPTSRSARRSKEPRDLIVITQPDRIVTNCSNPIKTRTTYARLLQLIFDIALTLWKIEPTTCTTSARSSLLQQPS
jgi:hypothetical protein